MQYREQQSANLLAIFTDFRDTWAFLDNRVRDAFDLKKTIQEVVSLCSFPFWLLSRFINSSHSGI